jgi:hypothetical protein
MNIQIASKVILTTVLISVSATVFPQAIKSEKAKIHINSNVSPDRMNPSLQVIEPKNMKEGVTFQADRQSVSIALRVINPTSETKVYVNNIEVSASTGGDIYLKTIDLRNGSNLLTLALHDKDKLISETVYSMLYLPQVVNISPYALNPGKYYALIVANGTYISPEIPTLRRPVPDAKVLRELLISKYTFDPENIYMLPDMKRANLIMALDELQSKLTTEDNLLIYYAGHGKMDEESGRGYWLLSDAVPSSRVDWFSNSNLTDYIKGFKAKHILLIADACFAGSIFYSRSVFDNAPPPIIDIYKNKSRTAMTSGGITEVNDESKFSEMLIMHLRENTDQYLTSSQLFRAIENSVMSTNSTAPRFGIIEDSNDMHGDFIFILRGK